MRFKTGIKNINTFIKRHEEQFFIYQPDINADTELITSLNSLSKVSWIQLSENQARFTVVPEQGSQAWAVIMIDAIFTEYSIESANPNQAINLEVPLPSLLRALRSAQNAVSASLRLTKSGGQPILCLTIQAHTTSMISTSTSSTRNRNGQNGNGNARSANTNAAETGNDGDDEPDEYGDPNDFDDDDDFPAFAHDSLSRETTITQEIPVRVMPVSAVEGIHEPRCRDPDVHIQLPSLAQLKAVSERYTKLAISSALGSGGGSSSSTGGAAKGGATGRFGRDKSGPGFSGALSSSVVPAKLVLAATMRGELRLGIETDSLRIQSTWTGLHNPEVDPASLEGGGGGGGRDEEALALGETPRARMREKEGEEAWAVVRIEGRDWGRVLGVGRLGGRVIACFCHEHALILYVFLPDESGREDSCLTYYIKSYSA
ncbi:hypothetical protein MMC25_001182 [Agyrium rufum]|nr:hypothetical protein [Agyrium rufum]